MSNDQPRRGQVAPEDADRQQQAPTGISQVLGRVFEQLSLTSWFPAAVLVGNGAVLVQMRANRSLSLGSAIVELTAQPLGILVVLLFALIIATVVTQAFEYEMIQLLEGYDWARGPGRYLMAARIRRHAAKRAKLEHKLDRLAKAAFEQARRTMANRNYDPRVLEALACMVYRKPTNHLDPDVLARARATKWRQHLPAEVGYRLDELRNRLKYYPEVSRLLPTRLGNHMRAAEDRLELGKDENLAGYVIRHHDRLPAAIRQEHDTYRARLEMYCSLVLVFVILAAGSVAALHGIASVPAQLAVVSGYLTASWVAYQAAIASAKGWGDAVNEIDRLIKQERAAREQIEQRVDPKGTSPAPSRLRSLFHRNAV